MRKKYLIIPIIVIAIFCIAFANLTKANNLANYAIEIVDDGNNNLNSDEQTSITKKIVEDNMSNIVYQVDFTNKQENVNSKEMSILIDTSKSMGINDKDRTMYLKASEFVENIFNKVENVKIAISDTTATKINMSNSSQKDNIKSVINSMQSTDAKSIDEGIEIAKNTFSNTSGKKYLVIFTDATDKITGVQNLEANGIEVITILTDMTRESYEVDGVSTVGLTYMMDSIDIDYICAQLNNSVSKVKITDIFKQDIIDYFDFQVVSKGTDDIVTQTSAGYIWSISEIKAKETATLKFRLTLKSDVNIPNEKIYQNIETSENTKVEYDISKETKSYDVAESPIIRICEKYNITIQAVSESNTELPVDGIDFNIIGKDSNGKEIYRNTLTTNNLGKVEITDLRTTGKVVFTVTPIVNKIGYESTAQTDITINNDITERKISIETDGLENTIDNENRKVLVKLPIKTKKFNLEINLQEENNSGVKLGGTEFRLIQPTFQNKYDFSALYGETDENGKLIFAPVIMAEKGTYDYILSQTTENDGYESMGNVTIRITFDKDGNIENIEEKYNDKVDAYKVNNSYGIVTVQNKNLLTDVFNFEINLKDKDTNYPLEGASYTIETKKADGNIVKYSGEKTDIYGKINLTLPGSGYVQIKITEEVPALGYKEDKQTKEMIIYRSEGFVQYVAKTTPSDLDTDVDTYGNKVTVNLKSEARNELNSIQIQLADLQENDIFIPNVNFTLKSLNPGAIQEVYYGTTDEQGIINFVIQPQSQGIYAYKLEIDNSTIPSGYSNIEDEIAISVTFDEKRFITDVSDISGPIYKCETTNIIDEENEKTYHTAYVGIGLEISDKDASNFKVNLTEESTGETIQGASYDITIKSGEVIRNKKGAKTNTDGVISTRIMPADTVEIEVKQVASKTGYVIDTETQLITLRRVNGAYIIASQEPYDFSDGKNGAKIEGTDIIYYNTNRRKTGADTRLNLYINKMDKENNLIENLPVRIYSDTLRNSDGTPLNVNTLTDKNGYIELEKIVVPEVEIPLGEREDILYIVETDGEGNDKESTLVKVKLAFRYNDNKQIIELTNAESTWGNRLIKSKTFNGYESSESYDSNLYLDIYTNYDEVGNFSMDFLKRNTEGISLSGAKYDIVITRPDGTNLIRKDLLITDSVEYEGIFVSEGTTIEITETEAPIGYELNEHTDIIRITDVDSLTGEVTAELASTSYAEARTIIESTQLIELEDGKIKTCINVELIDKELNNFKMGITTKDSVSALGIKNATYRVSTSKGAQVDTKAGDSEGKYSFKIGGSYSKETISYKINQLTTGEYYKKLKDEITLNIVFGDDKKVDVAATMAAQTDPGYGTIWEIIATNTNNGNDIDIQIKNEPQDPLTVKMESVDSITLNKIENISYKITPTVNLTGEGIEDIEVGYVSPNSTKVYQIVQTSEIATHKTMNKQSIKVVYDKDGNILGTPQVSGNLEVINVEGKTVEIRSKLDAKAPITIENIGYFDNTPLVNSQFEISLNGETKQLATKNNGIDNTLLGILGTNEYATYHVHQVKAPTGYALIDDFDVKVHYDTNKNIDSVELVNENRFVEVTYTSPSTDTDIGYNGNDKGIINIKIKSYPELKMNIENVDRLDNTVKLSGTTYKAESSINTRDDGVITEDNGIGVAHLDKTAIDKTVTYTIEETRAAALYQTIEDKVIINVTFDENGYISNCEVIQGKTYASVNKITNITTPEENFILNVQIKNNKMLKFNIIATDSVDSSYYLANCGFQATGILNDTQLSTDQAVTDNNGKAMLKMNKCLANETIVYTIKQTKKNAGYQFPSEDIKIEITFDSNGKIINDSVRILQASAYVQILNIDADTFNIDLKIINEETKQFGVNITSIDKYDDTVNLENVKYNAYLMTNDYSKDVNYTGETTTDENGEGYIQFNKYNAEYGQTRVLRLDETDLPDSYRAIRATILINIQFNENGEITDTTVPGGLNPYIGWIADSRFISVTHTKYTVCVTIRHYPYLNLNVVTEDMYTGEKLEAKYKISTSYGPGGYYTNASTTIMEEKIQNVQDKVYQEEKRIATLDDLVKYLSTDTSVTKIKNNQGEVRTIEVTISDRYVYTIDTNLQIIEARGPWTSTGGMTGYTNIDHIGYGPGEILQGEVTTTTDGEYAKLAIGPTEQTTALKASRTYYIYEEKEPTSPMQYQQYRPRYNYWEYSKIIGKITINYDTNGRIESYSIDKLTSNNNIDYNFIEVNTIDGYNLEIKVKCAPITTMELTTIDSVSKAPLSNTQVSPYGNSEYSTRQSYEYRTIGYYTTNSNGQTSFTYWGANINNGQNEYHINTRVMGYNGYYNSGTVKVKVAYDDNGRISAADVISTDENGMPNAEVVGFEDNKVKINILYYRKFNIQINKKDLYDSNTKLSSQFSITSSNGENKTVNSSKSTLLGIIRPGETVKYTLSETVTPSKYIPLENLDFYVTFNEDGSIANAWSNNNLFELVYARNEVVQTNNDNVKDLEINIKNEPEFSLNFNLVDKFYNEKKLSDVTFSIENDKGDVATGNPVTNENGRIEAPIGTVYPNETVTYTIKQTSKVNGYLEENLKIELQVEFNENGKIKDYNIISGNDSVNIDAEGYKNQRYIELTGMLTPKDVKLGIKNYNGVTKENISGVTYKITSQEIVGGSATKYTELITNDNGNVIGIVDEVKKLNTDRIVNYTISEINIPNTYRKIQDVIIQIRFGQDGRIMSRNILSNSSNVIVNVALGGKLQYLNGEDVHILLEIPNDNSYDLVIKNEDKNYKGLGIAETGYDININGDTLEGKTSTDGTLRIVNRTESGNIQIRIAENEVAAGYKRDANNDVTLDIEKGLNEYSIKLNSNSNPSYADVTVDEEYGIITVTFKNETRSSLTLVKDVAKVRYEITAKEKDSNGNYTNEKFIGTDISDSIAQERLHYELGVTPQNKFIVYTFEEVDVPGDYHQIGTFEVTVEYDIYGNIKNISDNSDRVNAIESPEDSHDIVVIISEYIPNNVKWDSEQGENGTGSLTIIKDNKDVRYEIASKEMDDSGNYSNETIIGSDLKDIIAKEELYYELSNLPKDKKMIFTIKEVSKPDDYESKGTIEVIADFNDKGLIYSIQDNNEKVEAKLIPIGSNDIVVIIGEEYGSLTLIKDNENVKYQISSKEEKDDGSYSNEKTIKTEEISDDAKGKVYICFREPIVDKKIVYTFTEISVPEEYEAKGKFEVKVEYDSAGKISNITSENELISAQENPTGSNDIFVKVMSEEEKKEAEEEELNKNKEKYTIRIASQEVDTNLRINESVFDIEINQGEGKLVQELKGVSTGNIDKKGYILEKGVITADAINKDGDIYVEVNQVDTADGYVYGSQKTSGLVHLNIEYEDVEDNEIRKPIITVVEDNGLEVSIDNTNKEITIKVYNEPEITMQILSNFEKKDNNGNKDITPQEGIHYTITSQVQTLTEITDTDLNVTTKATDEEGHTQVVVGRPYAGKSVIYTIKQEENDSYDKLEDILILVQYDTKGLIKYYEVLSNPDDVQILGNLKQRVISIQVTNRKQKIAENYKIVLEKHHIDDEEYGKLISGVKFKIHVNEEYGEELEWEAITDEDGLITSKEFSGYGRIEINITELETGSAFKLDGNTYTVRVRRDKNTGVLTEETSDNISFAYDKNDYSTIYVKPLNEPRDDSHTIVLNKTDLNKGSLITSSSAEFEVTRIELENHGTEEEPNIVEIPIDLGKIVTDNKGKARLEDLDSPSEPGTYKYIIKETKAPDGYDIALEEIVVEITFNYNDDNNMIIESSNILSGDAKVLSVKEKLLNISVYNENKEDILAEDEYKLDINKIDGETRENIAAEALFKMWLPNGLALYSETSTEIPGKLDKFYLETEAEEKAYLNKFKMPENPCTQTFVIREILAPEGYSKLEEELKFNIEFNYDKDGKMCIESCSTEGENIEFIETKDKSIKLNIINNIIKEDKITITYDLNNAGNIDVPEQQEVDENGEIIIHTVIPEREGYIFAGWSTQSNATIPEYQPGEIIKPTENTTLYAVWEEYLYLKSTEYVISDADNYATDAKLDENEYEETDTYIFGLKPHISNSESGRGTTIARLRSDIDTNADDIKVIKEDGSVLASDEYIGTGMTIVLTKGKQEIELTAIVLGDMNMDGLLEGNDITPISRYINQDDKSRFKKIEAILAIDVDLNGEILPNDLQKIRNANRTDNNKLLGI